MYQSNGTSGATPERGDGRFVGKRHRPICRRKVDYGTPAKELCIGLGRCPQTLSARRVWRGLNYFPAFLNHALARDFVSGYCADLSMAAMAAGLFFSALSDCANNMYALPMCLTPRLIAFLADKRA